MAFLKLRKDLLLVFFILILSLLIRTIALAEPKEYVFDEVYYAKFATALLHKNYEYDSHPPLGKFLISLGIRSLGENQLGYRIIPMLFGMLFLITIYLFARAFFEEKLTALLSLLLVSLEGTYLVYSRLSLLEIFMLSFGFLTLFFLTLYLKKEKLIFLFLGGLFEGLTISIKWIGAGIFPVAFVFWLLFAKKKTWKEAFLFLSAFLILPSIVYIASFTTIFREDFWVQLKLWHIQTWNYHTHLSATHPYSSSWFSWPFLIRPIWFYYKDLGERVSGILLLGNPLLWWLTTFAVIFGLVRNYFSTNVKLSALLSGWAIFFLPWAGISRVLFLYHYLFSSVFAYLILSQLLGEWLKKRRLKLAAIFFLLLGLASFLLYLPLWTGWPISKIIYSILIPFKSWI